jgi:hypothetical protein
MHSLAVTSYNPVLRSLKVGRAVEEVRRYILSKGGLDHMGDKDLVEMEKTIIDRDPEVIHVAREIIRILIKPAVRIDIKNNDTHYRLYHRLPWEVEYGPEKCSVCGCEISDTGYCCCSGAVD